ncbi:hypothetical protein ABMA27_010700 [Loxostege sticticalis]|uniref:Reverse transcriptase domain-containing protein n=1 Tax=Loxostege sticticalis TaxID=481309 RepID=A0ABR3H449_LOXSC
MMDSLNIIQELDDLGVTRSVACGIDSVTHFVGNSNQNTLSILTQNIRSIYKNIDDLQITLSQLPYDMDILILTECRLKPSKPVPKLPNYSHYCTTILLNQNDGVVVYVKDNLQTKIKQLNLSDATGLQITVSNHVILGIYRSPSHTNADNFVTSLHNYLDSISKYKNIMLLAIIKRVGQLPNSYTATRTQCINHSSFVLLDTDPPEVNRIIMSLDSESAPGWDGINTKFIKLAKDFLIPLITNLANLCFQAGTEVDKGGKCLVVFLDLKKAFDTVSIPILVHRLEGIGEGLSPTLMIPLSFSLVVLGMTFGQRRKGASFTNLLSCIIKLTVCSKFTLLRLFDLFKQINSDYASQNSSLAYSETQITHRPVRYLYDFRHFLPSNHRDRIKERII